MQFTDVSQKVIFSRSDVIDSFDTPAAFRYWIDKSMSDNLIKRVKRDMYAVVDPTTGNIYANKYLIACASAPAAYLIYHSALEYHGLSNQVYHTLYVASEQRFQNFEYNDIEYAYTQSPFAGQIETVDYGAKLRVTNKERTIVDCIANLKMSGGIEEVMNALEYMRKLDETRLKDCLNAYDNGFLYKRIGYFLGQFQETLKLSDSFFEFCKSKMNKTNQYFLKETNFNLVYNKDWRLYAPVYSDLAKLTNGGIG